MVSIGQKLCNLLLICALMLGATVCVGIEDKSATGIAVIAHKEISIQSITIEMVIDIFLKKTTELPDGSPVIPVDQDENTKSSAAFHQSVLKRPVSQMNSHWATLLFSGRGGPPIKKADDAEVLAYVASTPDSIGYVMSSSVNNQVRVLLRVQ